MSEEAGIGSAKNNHKQGERNMSGTVTLTVEQYEALKRGENPQGNKRTAPTAAKGFINMGAINGALDGDTRKVIAKLEVRADMEPGWYNVFVETDSETGQVRLTQSGNLRCNVRRQDNQ